MERRTPPPPSALMTTAHTPPSAEPLPPLESSEDMIHGFNMLDALLGAGVPHILLLVMSFLSLEELALAEQVCSLWRDIIEEFLVWKHAIERITETSSLWKGLFERRGWLKYLSQEVTSSSRPVNNFYRQLYRSASRDIHSLEANWRRGHYTPTRIQTGSAVICIQYNSDKIVSGHDDHTIKIWDRRTLQLKSTLVGHKRLVTCLQFNEQIVVSGSSDNSVKVWDIETGQMVNDLLHHKDGVNSLKFNSELLITGSNDQTVAVWDFKSPTAILRTVLKGHQSLVMAVDMTDTYIISGSWDGSIKVWDSSTGGLLHTLQHSDDVLSLQQRGSLIVSGCYDGTIRIWDIDTGECLRECRGHENTIMCIAVDDKRIVTGSDDRTVKVWSVPAALEPSTSTDALCITTLKEHTNYVYGVQFDDFQAISCSSDYTICIHDFLDSVPVDPVIAS